MNNIFENAYFGKPYKTMGGRKALYIEAKYSPCNDRIYLVLEGDKFITEYRPDGQGIYIVCQDIVSEWQDEINEEELDKLANAYKEEMQKFGWGFNLDEQELLKQTFKAGYRKALKNDKK